MPGYSRFIVHRNRDADLKNLGVRFGRYCIAKDIPALDVARYLAVTKQTVYNWFSGTHIPNKFYTDAINDFLNRK
jgi:hypothetical protein